MNPDVKILESFWLNNKNLLEKTKIESLLQCGILHHPEVDMVSGGLSTPLPSSILHTSHPEVDMVRGGNYQHLSLVVSYILVILRLIWWEGGTRRGKDKVASMHCKKTILEKLEFPWMLTFEVEWKSHTVDISMIYDFHSTASVNMHWNLNLFIC